MTEFQILGFAFLGGVIPSLLWLVFWIRQERTHHDPIGLIALSFIAGMLVVFLTPAFQELVAGMLINQKHLIVAWAAIEEILKFMAIYVVAFRSSQIHEPIDYVIYMTTIALGFAAMENTLFLITPLEQGDLIQTVVTGNFRFIGTTLIHVAASSVVGIAMALAFYKRRTIKIINMLFGLLGAIFLHAIFNYLIINYPGNENVLVIFGLVWLTMIVMIGFFQKVKKL